MKIYSAKAFELGGDNPVWVDPGEGQPAYKLPERQDLYHASSGFAWGYAGSGPSQLALAILADLKGDEYALEHYQLFKFKVIARLDQNLGFKLDEQNLLQVLERIENEGHRALEGR